MAPVAPVARAAPKKDSLFTDPPGIVVSCFNAVAMLMLADLTFQLGTESLVHWVATSLPNRNPTLTLTQP